MIRTLFRALNVVLILELVFRGRKETESTWAWILLLFNFPIIGFGLFLLTGQGIPKQGRKKREEYIGVLTEDNHVDILTTGEEKFAAVFSDIFNAKKEILIQYYIFKDDFLFEKMEELLLKKVTEGVKVRILYDRLGSRNMRGRRWQELKNKGVEVKCFRHRCKNTLVPLVFGLNYRNHRKILVVDGYIGYFGGYNVGKEYLGLENRFGFWRDTHFRLVGSAVDALRNIFLEDWGEKASFVPLYGGFAGSAVQMVASGPMSEAPHIRNVYLRCISGAKEKIWIQTPYFIPDTAVLNALKLALLSGKEVKLMIPNIPDHFFVHSATIYYAAELLQMGAKIYIYQKGFLHAKGIIMDHEVYCFGTANMDIRSFHLNYEVNAIVYGKEEVDKMSAIYEKDIEDCKELTWQEYDSRSLQNRVKEQISRLLSPLL